MGKASNAGSSDDGGLRDADQARVDEEAIKAEADRLEAERQANAAAAAADPNKLPPSCVWMVKGDERQPVNFVAVKEHQHLGWKLA